MLRFGSMEGKEITSADVGRWLARKRWDRATSADKKAVGKALADARAKAKKSSRGRDS